MFVHDERAGAAGTDINSEYGDIPSEGEKLATCTLTVSHSNTAAAFRNNSRHFRQTALPGNLSARDIRNASTLLLKAVHGQEDGEGSADPDGAFHADGAAMLSDDPGAGV